MKKKYCEACKKNGDDSQIYQNVSTVGKILSETVGSEFITEVIKNLKYRFLQESMDVLKSLETIFNPFNYPSSKDGLCNHGEEEH